MNPKPIKCLHEAKKKKKATVGSQKGRYACVVYTYAACVASDAGKDIHCTCDKRACHNNFKEYLTLSCCCCFFSEQKLQHASAWFNKRKAASQ